MFYRGAVAQLRRQPPKRLRLWPAAEREDAIQELLFHFVERDFRVLRQYRDQGDPFCKWFTVVAGHRLYDMWQERMRRLEFEPIDPERPEPSPPEPNPGTHRGIRDRVRNCMAQMNPFCRLLLIGEIVGGYTPKELSVLMGWGPRSNQEVGDKLRPCRSALKKCLLASGVDASLLREITEA